MNFCLVCATNTRCARDKHTSNTHTATYMPSVIHRRAVRLSDRDRISCAHQRTIQRGRPGKETLNVSNVFIRLESRSFQVHKSIDIRVLLLFYILFISMTTFLSSVYFYGCYSLIPCLSLSLFLTRSFSFYSLVRACSLYHPYR